MVQDPDVSQEDLDAGIKAVRDAIANLAEVPEEVDKEELRQEIEEAEKINKDKLEDSSRIALEVALENAKRVLEDPQASQDDVDKALVELKDAVAGLEYKPELDKTPLEKTLEAVKKIPQEVLDKKTSKSVELLEDAKANAQKVLDDPDASQEDLDQAIDMLLDAVIGLKDKHSPVTPVVKVDKQALEIILDTAKSIDMDELTDKSRADLRAVIEKAEKALEDEDISQEDVDIMVEEFKELLKTIEFAVVRTGYAKSKLYIRDENMEKAGYLLKGEDVTGRVNGAWLKFQRDGKVYYVANKFLQDDPIIVSGYAKFTQFVRDENYKKAGIIEVGHPVVGRLIGKRVQFELDGKEVYVYKQNIIDEKYEVLYVTSNVFVRSQASSKSEKVTIFKAGRKVIGSKKGAWIKTKYNGKEVYFAAKYASKELPEVKLVASTDVFIRSAASSKSQKIGILKKGTEVSGVRDGYWFRFSYKNDYGFVAAKFVK